MSDIDYRNERGKSGACGGGILAFGKAVSVALVRRGNQTDAENSLKDQADQVMHDDKGRHARGVQRGTGGLRQKREQGGSLISGDDVRQLTEILAGRASDAQPDDEPAS